MASNAKEKLSYLKVHSQIITARIRKMGKVLFSQVCVCQREGGGENPRPVVPGPFLRGRGCPWSLVPGPFWEGRRRGAPVLVLVGGGGTPVLVLVGGGVPLSWSGRGYPCPGPGGGGEYPWPSPGRVRGYPCPSQLLGQPPPPPPPPSQDTP